MDSVLIPWTVACSYPPLTVVEEFLFDSVVLTFVTSRAHAYSLQLSEILSVGQFDRNFEVP